MRTNAGYGMAGNPRDMITLADRRFPVRIRIGVPSGGLVSVMPKYPLGWMRTGALTDGS
jgi:hypothetical protein